MTYDDESSFVGHEPCPSCGSSDGLARYSDGHGYCFPCGAYFCAEEEASRQKKASKPMANDVLSIAEFNGEFRALIKRGISEETCKKFSYMCGSYGGKAVQVANYRDEDGAIIFQKVRFPDKEFISKGSNKSHPLFGRHLWNPS